MIQSISVRNVRLFSGAKPWAFDLAALTVLCGTNSAGKSTIAKIPLLLRQSQGIGEGNVGTTAMLRLVGAQLDLGTFRDFVSECDPTLDVGIGITVLGTIPRSALNALKLWKANQGRSGFAPPENVADIAPYTLSAQFTFGLRASGKPSKRAKKKGVPSDADAPIRPISDERAVLKRAHFEILSDEESLLSWQVALVPDPVHEQPGPPRYQLLLPTVLLKSVGWHELLELNEKSESQFTTFETTIVGLLPTGLRGKLRHPRGHERASRPQKVSTTVFPLPYAIGDATEDLRVALKGIHYLGPLRAPAKRFYVAETASDPGLDSTGEFLPFVLRDRGDEVVSCSSPGTFKPINASLTNALDLWMKYLRTGDVGAESDVSAEITVASTKGVLVELSVRSSIDGSEHALADSGFGFSQVLPVLVRALLAPPGATIIVEQPELHLHPALQVRLAEFFVGLGRVGKQVIVETHSEHVVNAMRVMAAEDAAGTTDCRVYFLDAPQGSPKVHRLELREDGTFDSWPRSFFGETAELRARLLRAQKRFLDVRPGGA